jgi:ATP-binding cassette subfamily A (ABC1) protein 3
MDPFARRATWELLQRNKAGRTIILSTHFMVHSSILLFSLGLHEAN